MSVINKMLQDLEQRQQSQATTSHSQQVPLPRSSSKKGYVWLALLLTLVLCSVFWFSNVSNSGNVSNNSQLQTGPAVAGSDAAASKTGQPAPAAEQRQQNDSTGAEPVAIMAALSVEPAAAVTVAAAVTRTVSEPDITAELPEPVMLKQVRTKQNVASSAGTAPRQLAVITSVEPELPPVARPQANVDKQPLDPAAQQQNMQLRANASEAAGDTSGAIVIWQQIIARQPAEANGYLNLARLWLKQQQVVSASQVLLQARQNGVLSAEINMQLAQLAVQQGQWQQALQFLADQFELAAEPEYFGFKATVLQQLQQHEDALNWYQRLQQLQPEQGRWSLGAALASEQLGQPLQAHQYYQHAWQHRQGLSVSSHNFIQQRLKATEP
ncbi:hypothetical protein SAMN06297280_3352 [Arsukibacterium tuosuense]|uniref:MSHA biogenesis protein MshN n=1 Tax=Arsukibacterium tuosuense TaxID=1323745 RepID=A0A285JDG4_9GAMM|nr:hypothetical protein [Arsukibacterium tuosuense]SNY58275.1 hypothetical protein SAMN06297280_3352 [Arsukibacterium tuosuense]